MRGGDLLSTVRTRLPTDRVGIATEYLTYGRQPRLLVRVWLAQVVLLLVEVEFVRTIHPFFLTVFGPDAVGEAYVAFTLAFLVVLGAILLDMGERTFAPRFHRVSHLPVSMAGYLVLASVAVLVTMSVRTVEGGLPVVDVLLASMTTAALALLLAVAFYAQFGVSGFADRQRTRQVVGAWLDTLDWVDEPEGSKRKDRRYVAFRNRTDQVADLLDDAVTTEGQQLRDEFEAWRSQFERYGLLTRERIVRGDVRNSELREHHERLRRLADRLRFVADAPSDTER